MSEKREQFEKALRETARRYKIEGRDYYAVENLNALDALMKIHEIAETRPELLDDVGDLMEDAQLGYVHDLGDESPKGLRALMNALQTFDVWPENEDERPDLHDEALSNLRSELEDILNEVAK